MDGGVLTMLAGLALVGLVGVLAPALLHVRGRAGFVLAALIAVAADIVVVSTATSVADRYTEGWVLAGHALVAAAVAGLWLRTGRPPVPRPGRPTRASVTRAFRAAPLVSAFGAAMAVVAGVQLFQALSVVSNGWDPIAYHLSRAAHWVQAQSVAQFDGGTARQLGYPINGELLQGWTMLLSGGDGLVNVVQWVAWLGTGLAVYGGARLLRFDVAGSALAGLLFLAMPIPVMQATTSQNDLIAALFVAVGAVMGVRGLRDGRLGEATVGAAALALALGTKGIVVVAGPSLALLAAVVIWRSSAARRILPRAAAAFAAALVLLTAFNFVQNLSDSGDLYGGARAGTERSVPIVENAVEVWWGFVDAPGAPLPWADQAAIKWTPDILGKELRPDFNPNDSQSAYGLVALLVLFPVLLGYALLPRAAPDRRVAAIATLLFFLTFPFAANADPDLTRLAAPGIVLGAPLLATLGRRPAPAAVAVLLATLTLVPCVLLNPLRQMLVPDVNEPAWAMDRTAQFGIARPALGQALGRVDGLVAPDAHVAFIGGDAAWEYPFFGPGLERRITRLDHVRELDLADMRRRGIVAAILDGFDGQRPPADMRSIQIADDFWLILPEPA